MGRVGSSSIHRSLAAAVDGQVLHAHAITPTYLAAQVANAGGLRSIARSVNDGLEANVALLRYEDRPQIVTLVRDAHARNLSAAFASFRAKHRDRTAELARDRRAVEDHWAEFHYKRPLEWFDQQLRDGLGIDVYERPFPTSGWQEIANRRIDLLIMRAELSDDEKSEVLGAFVGVRVPILNANIAHRSGEFAAAYKSFKSLVPVDAAYTIEVANSRYMRHFYG